MFPCSFEASASESQDIDVFRTIEVMHILLFKKDFIAEEKHFLLCDRLYVIIDDRDMTNQPNMNVLQ